MNKPIQILIAGDFAPTNRVQALFQQNKYDEVLKDVLQETSKADYSIVNLECPICEGNHPIIKTGPNLFTDASVIGALKYAGFNGVTLANNHINDYGSHGILNTIHELERAGIDCFGAGKDLESANRILFKEIKSEIFAFINICEHEWSIATDSVAGAAPLDLITLHKQINNAKKLAHNVVVIVHGGTELYAYPTPRIKRTYRFLIDCGADVVVSHHQHVYSGYEIYKNHPIIYGLGNFCFDSLKKRHEGWYKGYMVNLSFCEKSVSVRLIPYTQCDEEPKVTLLTETNDFQCKIKELNGIIADDEQLQMFYDKLVNSRIVSVRSLLEPYTNRILRYIVGKLGGPYLRSKKSYLFLLAHLQCEAHNDIFMDVLKKIVNKEYESSYNK